jgi:alkanesulfonate monooxygenase SsuD/methylene tetrahydromethanopterin reductase-like flavin-dependent oxidoreductase (luciferase family)
MTTVMVAPPRQAALLAKQAATLDHVAEGRFRLGIGVGGRPDGYVVLGRDLDHRDRQLDELLDALERTWWGEALPGAIGRSGRHHSPRGPPIVLGGTSAAALSGTGSP